MNTENINKRDSDGLKQGFWRSYYLNGNLQSEGHYVDDKKNGLWKSWHKNGNQWCEYNYLNNSIFGVWKCWSEKNGNLLFSYYLGLNAVDGLVPIFEGEQIIYEY